MECLRLLAEQNEKLILSPNAMLAVNSKGRLKDEPKCETRTDFQRDRDRIIHSKAFRRLMHKTQVFLSPESDHYRTRLTHTLEVSQIARTMARALRLNEDLTEAIALGHDLGHTPFGHAGEHALNELLPFSFTHYEQSVRVCERIEKAGKGLNLTYEVLNGIERHTKGEFASTLEGKLVRYADRIAYMNHDIDDAVRAGVLDADKIPKEIIENLGDTKTRRITTLVNAIVESSDTDIIMNPQIEKYSNMLHEFMYSEVYKNPVAKAEETKVLGLIEALFTHFSKNPEKMGEEYLRIMEIDGKTRAIADYIAGMSDQYAISVYTNTFIPKSWAL